MGRHLLYPDWQTRAARGGPRYRDREYCEWSGVVGDRMRRLRRARDLTLKDMVERIPRPDSPRPYTQGYFGRIEKGYASAPFYVYLAYAHALDVHPGRLLGADDAERDASPEEMTLVDYVRLAGIPPSVAIFTLTRHPPETYEHPPGDEVAAVVDPPPRPPPRGRPPRVNRGDPDPPRY